MEVPIMLTFTTNTQQYTTAAARTHSSQFTQYASKKQLAAANVLPASALQFLQSLKNTFTFAVHNSLQYAAVTLYYASTKSYAFIVVDLQNCAVAEVPSIKQAKSEILALVSATPAQPAPATQPAQPTAPSKPAKPPKVAKAAK